MDNRKITDYTYLRWLDTGDGKDYYVTQSLRLLRDGWQPFGSIALSPYGSSAVNIHAQAFVKYEEEDDE